MAYAINPVMHMWVWAGDPELPTCVQSSWRLCRAIQEVPTQGNVKEAWIAAGWKCWAGERPMYIQQFHNRKRFLSCQVSHFVEASGSYNPKSAPKKAGWVPWFCRGNILLHFWQVPHSVRAWGPQKQIWLYRMGTPNPPSAIFGGIFFVSFLMLDIHGYPNIWYNSVSRIILKLYFKW